MKVYPVTVSFGVWGWMAQKRYNKRLKGHCFQMVWHLFRATHHLETWNRIPSLWIMPESNTPKLHNPVHRHDQSHNSTIIKHSTVLNSFCKLCSNILSQPKTPQTTKDGWKRGKISDNPVPTREPAQREDWAKKDKALHCPAIEHCVRKEANGRPGGPEDCSTIPHCKLRWGPLQLYIIAPLGSSP